jgi:hypothetical protein
MLCSVAERSSSRRSIPTAEDFTAVARRLYLLVHTAADHTWLATTVQRSPGSEGAPMSLDFLLRPGVGRRATGADIRDVAIGLACDLIDDDLREGPIFSSILDEPPRPTSAAPASHDAHLPAPGARSPGNAVPAAPAALPLSTSHRAR